MDTVADVAVSDGLFGTILHGLLTAMLAREAMAMKVVVLRWGTFLLQRGAKRQFDLLAQRCATY